MEPRSGQSHFIKKCETIMALAKQSNVPLLSTVVRQLAESPHEPDSPEIREALAQFHRYAKLLDAELTVELTAGFFYVEPWFQNRFENKNNSGKTMNIRIFEPKEYAAFFKRITEFKIRRQKEISDGENDYNVITALLQQSDEVRLHSRFIYSLINPNGKHYQGWLFLKMFLDAIGVNNFNYKNAFVKKEFKKIDLYITDGFQHIIIENKIYACDQNKQIERYIDIVSSEIISETLSVEELYSKMFVVYLSPYKRIPSKQSLGIWSLINDKHLLECRIDNNKYYGYKIHYLNITYSNHVSAWLERLLKIDSLGLNMQHSIISYLDVIQRLTRRKRSNVMNIEEFLLDEKNVGDLILAGDISKKFESIKGDLLFKFFNNIKASVENNELNSNSVISSADYMSSLSQYVYSKSACDKWYSTGKDKEYYIGTFFNIDEDVQFGVMAAKYMLHFVVICNENTYMNLVNANNILKNHYPKRDWKANKTFSYYSKLTEFDLFQNIKNSDVLALLSDKSSAEYQAVIREILDVGKIISMRNLCSICNEVT